MLVTIMLATLVPASVSFLVIVLIKAQLLSRMGQALSLVATGLLLTLALTHLLPEAIEHSADIHDIGLTIWATIMVLIGLEMFFNSGHHADTCPVCVAARAARERAAAQKAAAPITKIKRVLPSSADAPQLVSAFEDYRRGGGLAPAADAVAPAVESAASVAPQPLDTRSTLHHLGHTHHFNLKSEDIAQATRRALRGGSLRAGLTNGGAPILAGSLCHALCDGIVIASSFMVDASVGVAVTAAIVAHEMPQQLSNYVLMLNFGMSRMQGFIVNLVAGVGALSGGLVFYNILDRATHILPYALGVAGGSFLYVALSDILPRVNKTDRKPIMLRRFAYLALGAVIAMVLSHLGHAH